MEHLREFLTEHLSWPLAREIVLLAVIAAIAIVSYFIMNYVMRKVKEIVEDTETKIDAYCSIPQCARHCRVWYRH